MDFATEKIAVQYRLDVNSSKKDNSLTFAAFCTKKS